MVFVRRSIATLVLVIAGCPPSAPVQRIIVSQPKPLSAPIAQTDVLLIADTHASNPMAPNLLRAQSELADAYISKTARRPPQLDAWGSRILDWVLANSGTPKLVLHLGDAANIACVSEMQTFLQSMKSAPAGRDWYMAPGNHDSLLMGNLALDDTTQLQAGTWNGECSNARATGPVGGSMRKFEFFREYLGAKGWPIPDYGNCLDVPQEILAGTRAKRVHVCFADEHSAYASYLLQEVELDSSTRIILLDTTQPVQMPQTFTARHLVRKLFSWRTLSLAPLGGAIGGMHDDQIAKLEEWLDANEKEQRKVLLVGHIPLNTLEYDAQRRLTTLISSHNIVTYVSAHTHSPTHVRRHTTSRSSDHGFMELNVGSTLDWPMQYATLSLITKPTPKLVVSVVDIAHSLETTCPTKWGPTSTDEYLNYKSPQQYAAARDAMCAQLETTLAVPKGFCNRELVDHSQMFADPRDAATVAQYERCQVVWASKAESTTPTPVLGRDPDLPKHVDVIPLRVVAPATSGTWTFDLTRRR